MSSSNTDIDDLVAKDVRELLIEHKDGERLNVTVKVRKLGVYKDRLYRRIKNVGSRTTRKPVNHKLSAVQETSLLRVTTETLHLGDLFFDDPSIMTEWTDMNRQPTWEEILMDGERMDSEGEVYYLYDRSPQNKGENEG